jgi:hypothetical protein
MVSFSFKTLWRVMVSVEREQGTYFRTTEATVLTAVTMNSTFFWVVTQYSLVEVQPCFEGMYCFLLQG